MSRIFSFFLVCIASLQSVTSVFASNSDIRSALLVDGDEGVGAGTDVTVQ